MPRQLPGVVAQFTNRGAEVAELDRLIGDQVTAHGPTPISTVTGGAGVGKTALVVHWAHRARARFPDGELYVNLRGYDSGPPVTPKQALEGFLRALDIPAERIPADLDARAGLFRSLVDDRRILIVLDNAASPPQIRPLLPGSSSCAVVVTGRSRMSGLVAREGAHRVTLDVLRSEDSVTLLRQIIGPERADAEPRAAAELARRCGHLPLALRIAADRVACHPHIALADLVEELSQEEYRLDALATGEDELSAVRVVFSWSYQELPSEPARVFRLLGLHVGPEIGTGATAALVGVPLGRARRLLDALTALHLLEQTGRDRYQFHDLLRAYATELAYSEETEAERASAIDRMLAWYLHTAHGAAKLLPRRHLIPLAPPKEPLTPLAFATSEEALDWYELERANLVAVVACAGEYGRDEITWRLPLALGSFFNLRKYWSDWVRTHRLGLEAAERADHTAAQAWTLTGLGSAHRDRGEYHDAVRRQRAAVELFARIDDPAGAASTHNNLAAALQSLGRRDEAFTEFATAVEIYHRIGDLSGQGRALGSQAVLLHELGRSTEAVEALLEAVRLLRDTDDRHGEGFTLYNLGVVYNGIGDFERAVEVHERSLALRRTTGNVWGEARTLRGLALAHRGLGDHHGAVENLRAAVGHFQSAGDDAAAAHTLADIGDTHHAMGDQERADDTWRTALRILIDLNDPLAATLRARLDASRPSP